MKRYDRTYDINPYLMHHGIPGQKWGVRRYQNPDGSLTEKGRKRLGIKKTKDMTEEELDVRIRRLQKEKQLRDLEQSQVKSGQRWIRGVAADSLKQGLTDAFKTSIAAGAKYMIAKGISGKNPQVAKTIFPGYSQPAKSKKP